MPIRIHRPCRLVLLSLWLTTCIAVAACGGSSKSPTSSATTAATATATRAGGPTPPAGDTSPPAGGSSSSTGPTGVPGRLAALRECLQRNGVLLPRRAPGERPRIPAGVSREKYEAALKRCGAPPRLGRFAAERFRNPAFTHALTAFAGCMRENGVNLPAPNTSGAGPIFNIRGIDTRSPQFTAAMTKCRSDLRAAIQSARRRPPGSG